MREEDMPYTSSGIRPTFLFNSHGIPSRMTVSTYLEILMGNLCAHKGTSTDATIFKKTDIETIANELEQYGLHRYGYERMMHGITGEFIDSLIFFGPTYYQRLQKFVVDTEYSVKHAVTDVITHQAIDGGKGTGGGLRVGEMEKDAIVSHGSAALLHEKFYNHSDGFTEYICSRCGKPAIVNHKEKLYKCNYCKDLARIGAVPSSWTSKLFMQELESANIGVRRLLKPFQYEVYDTEEKEFTTKPVYNDNAIKQLQLMKEAAEENLDLEIIEE